MSLEKIVKEALAGRPLEMKEAFEEVMEAKIMARLEEKYDEMMGVELDEEVEDLGEDVEDLAESDDEDEDEEDDEDDEDEEFENDE